GGCPVSKNRGGLPRGAHLERHRRRFTGVQGFSPSIGRPGRTRDGRGGVFLGDRLEVYRTRSTRLRDAPPDPLSSADPGGGRGDPLAARSGKPYRRSETDKPRRGRGEGSDEAPEAEGPLGRGSSASGMIVLRRGDTVVALLRFR